MSYNPEAPTVRCKCGLRVSKQNGKRINRKWYCKYCAEGRRLMSAEEKEPDNR